MQRFPAFLSALGSPFEPLLVLGSSSPLARNLFAKHSCFLREKQEGCKVYCLQVLHSAGRLSGFSMKYIRCEGCIQPQRDVCSSLALLGCKEWVCGPVFKRNPALVVAYRGFRGVLTPQNPHGWCPKWLLAPQKNPVALNAL